MTHEPLEAALSHAESFLRDLPNRPVKSMRDRDHLLRTLGGSLPEGSSDPVKVIDLLVDGAEAGLLATPSSRFFGFVIGGALPVAVAADWLTSAWDQNAGLYASSPSASVIEEISATWLKDFLGLPEHASVGFVSGGQMAEFVALAAARHNVLSKAGWDIAGDGLFGAPSIRVLANAQSHVTVGRALRYLGIGTNAVEPITVDERGRMRVEPLADALRRNDSPAIVCCQAGDVNTGAVDPVGDICDVAHNAGAWVHVDGAVGLWAAGVPSLQHLFVGLDNADSWAADAHKWLNVPYDSGLVFCAHPDAHRSAMGTHASYLIQTEAGRERDQMDWVPEFSRRARGFAVYAVMRMLGRAGIVEMVERSCVNARRFAQALMQAPNVEVLNDVVLNQVLVRFLADDGDHDRKTREVVRRVQDDGTCWLSGSTWQGKAVMRISVSNWATSAEDVDRSLDVILRCARDA
ncbi:MAG: aminotransferase class V-fold PLP-dependent enzyme [Actinomycetota bacterium]|nr:aminotransferase class V-fold PLP-dependent enzyme [Actinomycetota bacterium]